MSKVCGCQSAGQLRGRAASMQQRVECMKACRQVCSERHMLSNPMSPCLSEVYTLQHARCTHCNQPSTRLCMHRMCCKVSPRLRTGTTNFTDCSLTSVQRTNAGNERELPQHSWTAQPSFPPPSTRYLHGDPTICFAATSSAQQSSAPLYVCSLHSAKCALPLSASPRLLRSHSSRQKDC